MAIAASRRLLQQQPYSSTAPSALASKLVGSAGLSRGSSYDASFSRDALHDASFSRDALHAKKGLTHADYITLQFTKGKGPVSKARRLLVVNNNSSSSSNSSSNSMIFKSEAGLGADSSLQTLYGSRYLNYTANQSESLHSLVAAHTAEQAAALAYLTAHKVLANGSNSSFPVFNAILVKTELGVGLGNRIPSIVTGYLIAMLSRRIFLLDAGITHYVHVPLAAAWENFSRYYDVTNKNTTCHFSGTRLAASHLAELCGEKHRDPPLYRFTSYDYDIPWLQINDGYADTIKKLFPEGEVFHTLSKLLFRDPKPVLAEALAPYSKQSIDCLVGMHIRTVRLHVGDKPASASTYIEQVAQIAAGIAQQRPGNMFLASDSNKVVPYMLEALSGRQLWWNNKTMELHGREARTAAGNPGSELTAVVDMLLLSKCKHVVLTPASSFGYVAAGLGGIPGVFATLGHHQKPFFNTWYWRALTAEPCCWSMGMATLHGTSLRDKARHHPLFVHHNQFPDLIAPSQWE